MNSPWTQELRDEVIADYVQNLEAYETQEDKASVTLEVVSNLAKKHGKTVNSIRVILRTAEVYVKAGPTAKPKKAGTGTGTRVDKKAAHAALKEAIIARGHEADDNLISKLTGTCAKYLTEVMK